MFLYYNQITDLDKKALLKKKGFCKYFKLPPNKRRPNLIKSTIKIHLIQGYIKKHPQKVTECASAPQILPLKSKD